MVGWILAGAFLLLVIYLLTAPVWLEIDTEKEVYRAGFHWLLSISVSVRGGTLQMDMRFLRIKRKVVVDPSPRETEQPAKTKRRARKRRRPDGLPVRKIIAVLRSFRIRELTLQLDTGDQPVNGLLYPLAAWLRHRTGHDIRIGFNGESRLVLRIRNNLARMLWAYLRA